jgi:hypothetical protein
MLPINSYKDKAPGVQSGALSFFFVKQRRNGNPTLGSSPRSVPGVSSIAGAIERNYSSGLPNHWQQ